MDYQQPDVPQQAKFIKMTPQKAGFMALFVSIFYSFVWFYRQWKCLKKNDETYRGISPFWRALWFPFYSFSFVKAVKNELAFLPPPAEDEKPNQTGEQIKAVPYLIFVFFILIIMVFYASDAIGSGMGTIAAFLLVYIMSALQRGVNATLPADMPNESGFKLADFMSIVLLVFALVVLVIALLISPFSSYEEDKCFAENVITGADVKNDCLGMSAKFPFTGEPVNQDDSRLSQYKDGSMVFMYSLPFRDEAIESATDAKALAEQSYGDNIKVQNAYFKNIKDVKLFCMEALSEGDEHLNCYFNRGERVISISLVTTRGTQAKNKELFNNFINSLDFYPPAPKTE